ncbi:MAG TPA: hypothetical protein VGH87_08055 [Polyangiaceae bacterium]|jgi:hypothetical protein
MNRFVFLLIVSACGGTVTNDDAGVDAGDAASNDPCTPGTCRPQGDPTSACLPPGGPIGQPDAATLGGCCACGSDGFCSSPCVCASPDTPIATPFGDRPIASIAVGDLVLSVDHGVVVTVPVVRTKRTPVHDHRVIEVVVAGGAVLHVSAGIQPPTADGSAISALAIPSAASTSSPRASSRTSTTRPTTSCRPPTPARTSLPAPSSAAPSRPNVLASLRRSPRGHTNST